MSSSTSSWIKVAQGFKLVAQAASKIAIEETGTVAAKASRHSIDLAKNARNTTAHVANTTIQFRNESMGSSGGGVNGGINGSQHDRVEFEKFRMNETFIDSSTSFSSTVTMNETVEQTVQQQTNDSIDSIDNAKVETGIDSNSEITTATDISSSSSGTESTTNEEHEKIETHKPLHAETKVEDKEEIQSIENNPKIQDYSNIHNDQLQQQKKLKEGQAVPSTRIGRAMGFASLGVGLAAGTAVEFASRIVSRVTNNNNNNDTNTNNQGSIVTNDANSDRLAKTLCRMRGAALKLGQMMSIQDETLLAPPLARALEQVRQGADAMPLYQLEAKLEQELGEDWRDKFVKFDDMPFAAASIGQVHRATIIDNDNDNNGEEREVVVKCQYPGVADSIESDLNNLSMIVKMTGLTPPGLFIDNVIRVGRDELTVECNYLLEAQNQKRFRELVHNDDVLYKEKFRVPAVINDLSTQQVITTEFCPGGTIDKVAFLDQEERNRIGRNIIRLTIKELFVWRFMQTDPNWGNFLYDVGTGTTYLIDFGSAREYSKSFVDGYFRIVWANANRDTETLMDQSRKMGFLTGEENDIMLNAHKMSGFTVGEPFATDDAYDFAVSGVTGRLSDHGSAFMQHRLTPPPEEVYTLHRKLAGAYNLCIKLGAKIKCRDLLEETLREHVFDDGLDHPLD